MLENHRGNDTERDRIRTGILKMFEINRSIRAIRDVNHLGSIINENNDMDLGEKK